MYQGLYGKKTRHPLKIDSDLNIRDALMLRGHIEHEHDCTLNQPCALAAVLLPLHPPVSAILGYLLMLLSNGCIRVYMEKNKASPKNRLRYLHKGYLDAERSHGMKTKFYAKQALCSALLGHLLVFLVMGI